MSVYIGRFGGPALVLIAIVVGVLIGRVVESTAVGLVLFVVWTSAVRLLSAPAEDSPDRVPGRW